MALKKVGSCKYRVTVSVRDKNKGYPIAKQVTVVGTLAAAKIKEADLLRELKARSLTSAYASTFGEAVDIYVQKLRERGLSKGYERMMHLLRRELGHVRLEVFVERFEVYRQHLMTTPTVGGKIRKGSSVNRHTAIVRAIFGHLVDLEIIDKNPITPIRFPKMKECSRDRYMTQEERLRLLNAVRAYRPYILPIVQYMLAVPCRVNELVTAKREQYNPFQKTIYIPDSKAGIPIHKPIPEEMAEYFNSIPLDCPYLFYKKVGDEYRPLTNLRGAWATCLRRAGITDLHVHDLRHISATDLYDAGNPEMVIAGVAGWKTPDMLSRYYHKDSLRSAQRVVFNAKPQDVVPLRNVAAG